VQIRKPGMTQPVQRSARGIPMDAAIKKAIRQNILFTKVPPATLTAILARMTVRRYAPGELIFDESSGGRYLYLIISGVVRIKKYTKYGIESLLAVLHAGDFFGELSIIDELPRSARVEALEESTVVLFEAKEFEKLLQKSSDFTCNLLKNLAIRLRTLDRSFVAELDRHMGSSHAKLEQLNLLIEASKIVNSTIEIDKLLVLIMNAATHAIHAERGSLYLLDQAANELWTKVAQGDNITEIRLQIGKGLAGYVAQTGDVVNIGDAYQDPRFNPEIDRRSGFKTRNVLCMPMRDRAGEIVGVFQFLNKKSGPFLEEDASFIDALSVHAAIALENARLAQEMMNNERLSMVGKMAGTIIHDIKNPMSVLRLYAQLIKKKVQDPETATYADEMIRQVDRFVKMTQEVLDYSRGISELTVETVMLGDVIETALKFLETDMTSRGIALVRELEYVGECRLDPERMARVFYNLAGNAADAMQGGGTLAVHTEKTGDAIVITFSDTGSGIPDAIKARVLEPFFTHGKKHGTGLGLAIVKRIMDDHGGTIAIDSRENEGTTVRLTLPLPS
jgi:signal transduction histidine kinase